MYNEKKGSKAVTSFMCDDIKFLTNSPPRAFHFYNHRQNCWDHQVNFMGITYSPPPPHNTDWNPENSCSWFQHCLEVEGGEYLKGRYEGNYCNLRFTFTFIESDFCAYCYFGQDCSYLIGVFVSRLQAIKGKLHPYKDN